MHRIIIAGGAIAALGLTAVAGPSIGLNTPLTNTLTNAQEGITQDVANLLRGRFSGDIKDNSVTVGGYYKGGLYIERTDSPGKFPILGRFPNQHSDGRTNNEFVTNQAGGLAVAQLGKYVTGVVQAEYSNVNFNRDQDDVMVREAYVIASNPEAHGGYVAYGRKTIDFGEHTGYNPFTHSINQHFFWAQADDPVVEAGYVGKDWRVSATAANGERMLRTGMTTDRSGGLGTNWAVKGEKSFEVGKDKAVRVSASYLDGSIYNNNFTAHTVNAINRQGPPNAPLPPNVNIEYDNALYDAGIEYTSPKIDLTAEYTTSDKVWPATSFDTDTGDRLDGTRNLDALTVMGRYKTEIAGKPAKLSAVFSKSNIGPENTEFDEVYQHAVGAEVAINKYVDLSAELVVNEGFQPFVGIQDVSDSSVQSRVAIVGLRARF